MLALFHSLKEELLFLISTYSFIATSHESLKSERNTIHTKLPSHSDWLTHNLRWSAYGYKLFAMMAIPVAEKLRAVILLLCMDSLSYQRAPHLSDLLVYNNDIVGPAILPLACKGSFDAAIRDHVLKVVPSSRTSSATSGSVYRKDRTPSASRSADKSPQPQGSFRPPYPRGPYHPQLQPRSHVVSQPHQTMARLQSTPLKELLNNTLRDRINPDRTPAELMRTAEPRPTPSFRSTAELVSDAPGGCLTIFVDQWWSAPRSIFNTIKKGFHWTWQSQAPQLCIPTHLDSTPNPDLSLAITDLLSKQAIYQVSPQPCFLSHVFLVPKRTGGLRFIINLTQLNKHIHCPRFHMSNHSVLADMLSAPAWMTSIDLSDVYFHVPIKATLHKYLAFTHDGKLFFFRALPFGLNVAPYIFTRILRYPLSLLHQQGIPVLAYIDDWIMFSVAPTTSRREWERLLGALNFVTQILPRSRHLLQPLLKPQLLSTPANRDRKVPIPTRLRRALLPWLTQPLLQNTGPFYSTQDPVLLWTDASLSTAVSGSWTPLEEHLHIYLLEVRAVHHCLLHLDLSHQWIHLFIDNAPAQCAINKLSCKSPNLLKEVTHLVHLLQLRSLKIKAFRISTLLNAKADALSRTSHPLLEWELPQKTFHQLQLLRGPLEIDLMATSENSKLPLFISPHPHPQAWGHSALAWDWKQWSQIYIFPPK
ncbi:hypothetical protein O3P69_018275 [Scylla paramamosain]|uniref:Reverse transcriptase domain-containing protein n=1 Tax=Scylla paramamosain TaxID=85552 RepID=A0AAW0TJ25_SCYPA